MKRILLMRPSHLIGLTVALVAILFAPLVYAATLGDAANKTTLGNDVIGGSKFIYSLGGISISTTTTSTGAIILGTGGLRFSDGSTQITSAQTTANFWALSGVNLYPTSTTYKVAIGSTVATSSLTVTGDGIFYGASGNISAGVYYDRTNTAYYLDPGANENAYSLTTAGNIGIGATAPGNRLAIQIAGSGSSISAGIANSAIRIKDTNTGANSKYGISWERADQTYTIAAIEPEVSGGWPTALKFFTNTDGATQITEKMRITAAGNVGIGTTNPGSNRLQVTGGTAQFDSGIILPAGATNTFGTAQKVMYGNWGSNNMVSGDSADKWIQVAQFTLNGSYQAMRMLVEGGGRTSGGVSEGNPTTFYVHARNGTAGIDTANGYIKPLISTSPSVKDVALVHRSSGGGTTNNVFELWIQFGAGWQDSFPVKATWWGTGTMNSVVDVPQPQQASITAGYITLYPVNYYDFTQGRLGIGTTVFNPGITLAVGDSDTGLSWVSENNLAIYTGNSERVRINSSGYVGIATTTPAYPLTVNGTIASLTGGFRFPDGTTQTTSAVGGGGYWSLSGVNLYPTSTSYKAVIGGTVATSSLTVIGDATLYGASGNISVGVYYDRTNTAYYLDPGANENAYSLTVAGSVGIGTTGPGRTLDARGSIVLADADVSANSYYGASGDNGIVATTGAGNSALALFNTNASFTNSVLEVGAVRTSNSAYWLFRAWQGNGSTSGFSTQVFGIRGDGNVGIATTTPSHKLTIDGAYYSKMVQRGNVSGSVTIDWNSGNTQHLILTGNITTLTLTNGQSGGRYTLVIKQGGTGGYEITWPASTRFSGPNPSLSNAVGDTDYVGFIYNGVDAIYDGVAVNLGF